MIELYTKKKLDKIKARETTIIAVIKIDGKIMSKFDPEKSQTDLTPLKNRIGETVYIYTKGGKTYSHKARIDNIQPTEEEGVIGDILQLGPVDNRLTTDKIMTMESALIAARKGQTISLEINGGVPNAEVISGESGTGFSGKVSV